MPVFGYIAPMHFGGAVLFVLHPGALITLMAYRARGRDTATPFKRTVSHEQSTELDRGSPQPQKPKARLPEEHRHFVPKCGHDIATTLGNGCDYGNVISCQVPPLAVCTNLAMTLENGMVVWILR
jgi:hypothetical protein